jgi:hypothetical protein
MKESQAHKLSLALPLVVPSLVAPLVLGNFSLPAWLSTLVSFIWVSGMVGGVPYLVLVALLFWWGRGKSEVQFRRAFASPVLMFPVFFAFLGFGCAYVLLVLRTGFVLKRMGLIPPSPAA